MIYGIDKSDNKQIKIPIENYANQLIWHMKWYLNKLQDNMQLFSNKANEKAKITL